MASMKLTYFDGKGRGEMIRLVLTAAGKKYEDVRVTFEKWPEMKPKIASGQLPCLEIDGKQYGQSVAIATYLARENGLYGKTNLDGLLIDQVIGLIQDIIQKGVKYFFEKDEAKQAELKKEFAETYLPTCCSMFEKMLEENKSGYFAGASMSLADLAVYDLVTGMFAKDMCDMAKCPMLKALVDKIGADEKIKEYMAKRPETQF